MAASKVQKSASGKRVKEAKSAANGGPIFVAKAFAGAIAVSLLASLGGVAQWWYAEPLQARVTKALMNQKEALERQLREHQAHRDSLEQDTGLGPSVMAAQGDLIGRLLHLAQEVESVQGEDKREERLEVSKRVEEELLRMEQDMAGEAETAVGKQQTALIALVRSAVQRDMDGAAVSDDDEAWSEEALRKRHGLVTYASAAYWEEAYSKNGYGDTFDWYGTWEEKDLNGVTLADVMRPMIKKDARILMLGCGNSNVSALMHGEGYRHIVNVDVAEPVIAQMRQRYSHLPDLEWHAMDASAMTFPNDTFDVVVEKGLFDALYAGTGELVQRTLAEVRRVLRPGARLVSVSFGGDRLDRLFKGEEDASQSRPMGCSLAGELAYRKARVKQASFEEDVLKHNTKAIFIYSCDEHP